MFSVVSAQVPVNCMCTHSVQVCVCVCMYQCIHNTIWKFTQNTLLIFPKSSSSDNKMTKSSIISLFMYRVNGCTWANSFHTHCWCLLVVYCAVAPDKWQQLDGWVNNWHTGLHIHELCVEPVALGIAAYMDDMQTEQTGWVENFSVHELINERLAEGTMLTTAATTATYIWKSWTQNDSVVQPLSSEYHCLLNPVFKTNRSPESEV